ncbi:hypothetical protein [Streptomyces sp. NPDC090112]|uniref:hypothetical protein n=1 Tax=Streptomyces sp. NPDC090112 TaxID=3365949 RepID=UPI00381DABA9
MALPGKGSRPLTVDGVQYRWRLRGRPTYDRGLARSPVTYAVERTGASGAVLVVTTRHTHPGNWLCVPAVPVLPRQVSDGIRAALARGWVPTMPGPPFRMEQAEQSGQAQESARHVPFG